MAAPMFLIETRNETKPKTTRKGNTQNQNQKKLPQRGLGVAQLERLRLQERWKKMTEIPPLPQPQPQPLPSPMPMAANNNMGFVVQRMGGPSSSASAAASSGFGGFMAMDPRFLFENSSMELSSIPNINPHCDLCFKKKRFNNFNNAMFRNGIKLESDIESEMPYFNNNNNNNNNHCDFLGLNIQNYPISSFRGGAEVKQIHRKVGNRVEGGEGSRFLMEYEFFPDQGRKEDAGTYFKELEFPTEEEATATVTAISFDGEASCITSSTTPTPNALDLSLKLSL